MSQNTQTEIEKLADIVSSEINKATIPKWDLYLLDEQLFGVYFRKNITELATDSRNLSYFIRVIEDRTPEEVGVGLVHLNSKSPELIQKGIRQAKAIAKINTSTPFNLVSPGLTYPEPKTFEKEVWEDPAEFTREQESALHGYLNELTDVESKFAKFRTYKTQKMLVNSEGFRKRKQSTYFFYEFSFVAQNNGKLAEYWPSGYLKTIDQLQFEDYIREWSSRAKDALIAKPPPNRESISVIFPAPVVREAILQTLGHAVTGQARYEKTSAYDENQTVAPESFTMMDDGLVEGGLNTSAWDSEGNPKQKTTIIEKGIMKNFLYDEKYAHLLQTKSTGNAQRGTTSGGIMSVELNNLVIAPGTQKLREIVKDCKEAIYVNDFSWLKPNPITGMFGAEIRHAYWIENGELKQPIVGGNLSGNVFDMVKNIEAISSETRVVENAHVPYIKFAGVSLSSE